MCDAPYTDFVFASFSKVLAVGRWDTTAITPAVHSNGVYLRPLGHNSVSCTHEGPLGRNDPIVKAEVVRVPSIVLTVVIMLPQCRKSCRAVVSYKNFLT